MENQKEVEGQEEPITAPNQLWERLFEIQSWIILVVAIAPLASAMFLTKDGLEMADFDITMMLIAVSIISVPAIPLAVVAVILRKKRDPWQWRYQYMALLWLFVCSVFPFVVFSQPFNAEYVDPSEPRTRMQTLLLPLIYVMVPVALGMLYTSFTSLVRKYRNTWIAWFITIIFIVSSVLFVNAVFNAKPSEIHEPVLSEIRDTQTNEVVALASVYGVNKTSENVWYLEFFDPSSLVKKLQLPEPLKRSAEYHHRYYQVWVVKKNEDKTQYLPVQAFMFDDRHPDKNTLVLLPEALQMGQIQPAKDLTDINDSDMQMIEVVISTEVWSGVENNALHAQTEPKNVIAHGTFSLIDTDDEIRLFKDYKTDIGTQWPVVRSSVYYYQVEGLTGSAGEVLPDGSYQEKDTWTSPEELKRRGWPWIE